MRFLLSLLLTGSPLLACLNYRYTVVDEHARDGLLLQILVGAMPEHSEEYYFQLARDAEAILADGPNLEASIDLAVSHIKRHHFDMARNILESLAIAHPNSYAVHANLAVLAKKDERLDDAVAAMTRALAIRPNGHMNLGDYYLRMLRWRAEFPKEGVPENNFLDVPYALPPEELVKLPQVNRGYLISLIINDPHFAEAYIVLGDVLQAEGDFTGARLAYSRTQEMRHWMALERTLEPKHPIFLHASNWDIQLQRAVKEAREWCELWRCREIDLISSTPLDQLPVAMSEFRRTRPVPVLHAQVMNFWAVVVAQSFLLELGLASFLIVGWRFRNEPPTAREALVAGIFALALGLAAFHEATTGTAWLISLLSSLQ
jgi:tetratricopeptide (TPR) repeat protein